MATKKSQINTIDELNNSLHNCLNDIIKTGASSKGNNFDETIRDKLKDHLSGAKFISTEQWCSKDKDSIFLSHYNTTLANKFDFTHLPTIVDNGRQLNLMIVDKPNGSQKWPDLLVVFNGIGLPIEIKSAKNDNILWNSGIPKANSIYIYNCYGKSKTTFFLGQHAINDDEVNFLLLQSQIAQELNKRHNNNKWSYYVRDMFNSNQSFFENDDLIKKCEKYQQKINDFDIELNSIDPNDPNPRNLIKRNKIKVEINLLKNNLNKTNLDYQEQLQKRLSIQNETLNFTKSLSWNSSQKTNFNLDLNNVKIIKNKI